MRRKFTRRKPKVVWLPTVGYTQANQEVAESEPWRFFGDGRYTGLTIPAEGAGAGSGDAQRITEVVTFDDTFRTTQLEYDTEYSGASLRDMVSGQEYRLRRVLGRVYCSFNPAAAGQHAVLPAVEVSAGLMVRNFGDNQGIIGTEVHPLAGLSTEDPWIWKKHWLLGNYNLSSSANAASLTAEQKWWQFPSANWAYGSIVDGPQIDQKTARVIRRGERLVMHFAVRPIVVGIAGSPEPIGQSGGQVNFWWNMRVLASLKGSAYGNRGNASR